MSIPLPPLSSLSLATPRIDITSGTTMPAEAVRPHGRTLSSIPYDLIRLLCTLLSGTNISSLLCTSRTLHTLSSDEAIWQELCGRYGLTDPITLGSRSFRTVYTALLHTYGPLLGLWASDHPYRGSIIEFRIDTALKCIVGEVWRFWVRVPDADPSEVEVLALPEYFQFMDISLTRTDQGQDRALLKWSVDDAEQREYYGPGNASVCVPTMHVYTPTDLGIELRIPQTMRVSEPGCVLPAFPPPHARLYDSSRGSEMPRLKRIAPPSTPTPDHVSGVRIPYVAAVRTPHTLPAALVIRPPERTRMPQRDWFATHEPRQPIVDARNDAYGPDDVGWFYRRFYPLRSVVREGMDPAINSNISAESGEGWRPESLEGLWLGSYGPHGTEVLYLEYVREENEVRAWKVTGDLNVPRGVVSWTVHLNTPLDPSTQPGGRNLTGLKRVYRGDGVVSGVGFFEGSRRTISNLVAITGKDEIRISWVELHEEYTPVYVRYKGRDVSTETKEHLLRRPAGWTA